MKVSELKKIIQEAVRTEVRKVLREELKSLSLTESVKKETPKPKVQEFKEHNLTRSPRKPLVDFGVKDSVLNDVFTRDYSALMDVMDKK